MISDTLSGAAAEIREYLATYPDAYTECRAEIDRALLVMDGLRQYLDSPPANTPEEAARYRNWWLDGPWRAAARVLDGESHD